MDHNDIRHKLSEYIDDAFTAGERTAIEAHLATCAECTDALRELRKTIEHLHTVEEIEPPAWMTQRIMARVRSETVQPRGFFRTLIDALAVLRPVRVIAVLFLAVTAYYLYLNMHPAERYLPAQQQEVSEQQAPAIHSVPSERKPEARTQVAGRNAETEGLARDEIGPPGKNVGQAPGYRSLDMKYSYEKPAPPEPAAPSAPAPLAAKRAEIPEAAGRLEAERPSAVPSARSGKQATLTEEAAPMAQSDEIAGESAPGTAFRLTVQAGNVPRALDAAAKAVIDAGGRIRRKDIRPDGSVLTAEIPPAEITEITKRLERLGMVTVHDHGTPVRNSIVLVILVTSSPTASPPAEKTREK